MRTALLGALPLLLSVCSSGIPNSSPPDEEEQRKQEIVQLMRRQLAAVATIHRAIAFGDLKNARKASSWLANNAMVGDVPASWVPHIKQVQLHSEQVAANKKLGDVAIELGGLIAACGRCHQELSITFAVEREPEQSGVSVDSRMRQHASSMKELELGVILPDLERWRGGAKSIAEGSFSLTYDPIADIESKSIEQLSAELGAMGSTAIQTTDLSEQASLYGRMMATCHDCHDQSREE